MARIRTIKPEFWTSDQVMECSTNARLLFIGLWNFCDDAGNHPFSPKSIKAKIFPGDDISSDDIRRMFDELSSNGLIVFYDVEDQRFFHVTGWDKHQKIDRPSYKYPPFNPESEHPIRRALVERHPPEGSGREGKGEEPPLPPQSKTDEPTGEPQSPARLVALAFVSAREGLWPREPSMAAPLQTLDAEAAQWLADGFAVDRLISEIQSQMTRVAERGKSPPKSLAFFRLSLTDALARHKAVAAPGVVYDPAGSQWRARLNGFAAGRKWLAMWGPEPGEPRCQVPTHVRDEFPNIFREKTEAA